jgi:glycosyltransferase involved in cell wall biosynthesis
MNKNLQEKHPKNKVLYKNEPLISIVTVVYNGERFLKDSIESVINQNYQNIEYIVIDGGSSDNTVNIIKQYEDKIDYWISEKDSGQSDAFSKAFAKCRGEWITWLNADDLLLPNTISVLIQSVKSYPDVDCFMGNIIWADANGFVIKCRQGERWANSLPQNGFLNVYGPTTFFKNKLYKSVMGIDHSLHYRMDTDLWWQFFNAGAKFMRLKNYSWMLRVHEDAKTTANYFLNNKKQEKVLEIMNHETEVIRTKYNLQQTFKGRLLLFFHRVTSLCYLRSLFDSFRYKSRHYTRIKLSD